MIPVTYDKEGRTNFHPDYHFSHGRKWTEDELEYLCKFIDYDGPRSMQFAIGKTEKTIRTKLNNLRRSGEYEYYKNLRKHW